MPVAATTTFNGFSPAALRFLRDLAKNNERSWFTPRKEMYERELLEPLRALVADASVAMAKAKIPLAAGPKGGTFRIYRDVRFSPDKSPYKTNLGAYLSSGGSHGQGGLYVHIQPKQCFMAIAFYQLERPQLQRWREAMARDPKAFAAMLRALAKNGLELSEQNEVLKRMPRGFEAQSDSPLAKYFRIGSFTVSEKLADDDVKTQALIGRMVALAKKAKPLMEYGWANV